MAKLSKLRVQGDAVADAEGARVLLRGVGLGGWMNMENFITGYPATESEMRAGVARVLGADVAERFFDTLLDRFFAAEDAGFLAELGVNCIRLPVNYRHFESDAKPFELIEKGFERLDRAIRACGEHGIYSVIDLHAVPGAQNQHWHSDNLTARAELWRHPHFQDRVVHLWEAFADRYKDWPEVGGYNLLNEPADPSGEVVGPFHDRLVAAVRAIDPETIVFVDGNTYSTDFSMFARAPTRTRSSPATTTPARAWPSAVRIPARHKGSGSTATRSRRRSWIARGSSASPARRSGSASSARCTPARRSATRCATGSSPTSSTSTTSTRPAGRSGPTRTSACRGSSTRRPTARTCTASGTSSRRRGAWASTPGARPTRRSRRSSSRSTS